MTWLYLPATTSASAPAEAASPRATSPRRAQDGVTWWAFGFGPAGSTPFAQFYVADSHCVYSKERGFGWIPQCAGKDVPGLAERDRGGKTKGKSRGLPTDALYRNLVMTSAYYHPQVRQTFALDKTAHRGADHFVVFAIYRARDHCALL